MSTTTDKTETAVSFPTLASFPIKLLHLNSSVAKGFPPFSLQIRVTCAPSSNSKFEALANIKRSDVGGSKKEKKIFLISNNQKKFKCLNKFFYSKQHVTKTEHVKLLNSKISIKVMLHNKHHKYNLRLTLNNIYMYV